MELTLAVIAFISLSAAVGTLGWLARSGQSRSHRANDALINVVDRLLSERAALQSTVNKTIDSLLERCEMLEEADGERADLLKRFMNESYDHAVRGFDLEKMRMDAAKRELGREVSRETMLGDTPMAGPGVNGRMSAGSGEEVGATSQFAD